MITDGAPQHRSKFVREEIGRLDGVELQFLPPGCPDLNAIEEVWRQMKHAILDVPYVRFSSMCSDIDKWLRSSLPKLDIENTSTEKHRQAPAGAQRTGNGKRPPNGPSRINEPVFRDKNNWFPRRLNGNPVFGDRRLFAELYSNVQPCHDYL